ncbi:MAG TPA: DUF1232 domain-containing protein [Syntrophomonadaceae bacterium]|nr:DUF1232 domain-containing protein [Syntrophomonadaceae bacterium]HNX29292.1 DUF1232 domain-containing protein [Syntrophomonadaceae bacterium]HPR92988.1 DUF1232 domain-containing protein [Syntrophomonadaceae bacterium]
MSIKEKADALKVYIPALFLAIKKPETPLAAKIAAGITVAYALSPIDIVPDFIPVLGYLDDLIILPLLAALAIKLIPDEIMERCKAEAEGLWIEGNPEKWKYAIPVIIIWTVIITAIVWKIID